MIRDYSERERKLLKFFGVDELARSRTVPKSSVYRAAMEKAFVEDLKGPEVESLRKCLRALRSDSHSQDDEEWDKMIELSDDPVLIVSRR